MLKLFALKNYRCDREKSDKAPLRYGIISPLKVAMNGRTRERWRGGGETKRERWVEGGEKRMVGGGAEREREEIERASISFLVFHIILCKHPL